MKTISVREAAEALGLTTRAVLYRREKGQLKGILTKNNGIDEYRIYPNKEIMEGLRRMGSPLVSDNELLSEEEGSEPAQASVATAPEVETLAARLEELEAAFKRSSVEEPGTAREPEERRVLDDADHIDVDVDIVGESSHASEENKDPSTSEGAEKEQKSGVDGILDHIWDNLISRYQAVIEQKDQLIGSLETELADKDRQLKLLPDKQSKEIEEERQRAEQERRNAQRTARELEEERIRREEERARGEAERKRAEENAREVEQERLRAEEEKKKAELKELEIQALRKQVEVVSGLKESTEASRLAIQEELDRIKREKEEKERAVQEELQSLASKLEEMKRPWYKKWFSWKAVED
ncbi:MAG: hypothetical protein K8F91_20425 [Candidatus Obscuribacterales bacterium]|nr:hypothetical protein [Candidatus Obscuribacterales bacterium]